MLHRALAVAGAVGAFVTIVTLLHHAPPRSTRLRTAEERAIVYRDGERRAAASRTSLAAALAASANRPTRELVRQGASFNAVDTSCHTEQGELDDACVARDGGWTCVQLCWPSTMQRIAAVRLNVRLGCRCTELDCIRYQGSALIGGYRSHAFTCTFRMDERKPSPPSPRSPPPSEPPLPPSAPMPPDSGADHSPTPLGIMATTRVADTPAQEDQTAPNDLNCDGAVRLTTYPEGNLQLRRDGKWGSVCALYFRNSNKGADLACRALGYPAGAESVRLQDESRNTQFRRMPLAFAGSICTGEESGLAQCREVGETRRRCSRHAFDAVVRCAGVRVLPLNKSDVVMNRRR